MVLTVFCKARPRAVSRNKVRAPSVCRWLRCDLCHCDAVAERSVGRRAGTRCLPDRISDSYADQAYPCELEGRKRPFLPRITSRTQVQLWSEVCLQLRCDDRDLLSPNEKATRQLGGLFFQGRIVLTEGKFRQNFLAKSYEPKKQGVKQILDNKCLYFQQLMKGANSLENCSILRLRSQLTVLKRFN